MNGEFPAKEAVAIIDYFTAYVKDLYEKDGGDIPLRWEQLPERIKDAEIMFYVKDVMANVLQNRKET